MNKIHYPSVDQLIDTINWIIARNRETLPISDLAVLEEVKDELLKITAHKKQIGRNETVSALTDVAVKLVRFFLQQTAGEWLDKIN